MLTHQGCTLRLLFYNTLLGNMKVARSEPRNKNPRFFIQVRLQGINSVREQTQPLKALLYKGVQKLDETKEPIHLAQGQNILDEMEASLSFYMTGADNTKACQYRLVLETVGLSPVGQIKINSHPLLEDFNNKGQTKFSQKQTMGEDLEVEYLIFVEKTKQNLENSVRSFSDSNSVARFKTEPNRSVNESIIHSKSSSGNRNTKSRDNESGDAINLSLSLDFVTVSAEKDDRKHPYVQDLLSQRSLDLSPEEKVSQDENLVEQLDNFDSISMIGEQKQSGRNIFSVKLILGSAVVFLILLCYFIITIEEQQLELRRIKEVVVRTLAGRQF